MSSKAHIKKSIKSKHKHDYEEVVLRMSGLTTSYHVGKRCKICGKTKLTQLFVSEKIANGYRVLNSEEILEKFSGSAIYDYDWGISYT